MNQRFPARVAAALARGQAHLTAIAAGAARAGVVFSGRMKSKTSITLSEDVLANVKRAARKGESRSETIERLLRERLSEEAARRAREKEIALINRHADELNAEMADVLTYQVEP